MAAWSPFVVATMHLHAELERDLKAAFDVTLLDHGILLMLRHSASGVRLPPAVSGATGGLTMGHLAAQFGTEASVITYRVKRLEGRDLVTRERGEPDRREVYVRITAVGERLCEQMGPVHVASVRRHFLDHIPRRDLPALADAFTRLYRAQDLSARG